jgi:Virulence factor membrane-bound polymerase, C-terminal
MTPFVNRPTAFFDHTHNLPLQLLVELGVPLALAVMALLAVALWQGWRRAGAAADDGMAICSRAALVLVLLTGLHSLVEYPLWYAYFLLPTALAWGLVLGLPAAGQDAPAAAWRLPSLSGAVFGALMAAAGVLAVLDYQRVVVIYAPTDGSGSLATRIARGQLSPLFAHQADYAAATNTVPPASQALGLARSIHALLDTRLMMAWSRQLAASGHTDEARWVAQRLRDFRNPDAAEFFAPCVAGVPPASLPFQCQAPQQAHGWRHLASLPPLLEAAPPALPATATQPAASATQ